MMWMVDEFTQTVKEMLLEGSLHNIFVFTIITSSSVLSVVGAVRHLYTFIHNIRQRHQVNIIPSTTSSLDRGESDSEESLDSLCLEPLEKFNYPNLVNDFSTGKQKHKKEDNTYLSSRENSPKCLKCDGGTWERHCVQGLCQKCCENSGGCQVEGHNKQPEAYSPWFERTSASDQVISISCLDLQEFPPRFGFHCMNAYGLDASHNNIAMIPEQLTLMRRLMNISLSYNKLTYIPDYFSALHKLSFVDLRNNKISKFPECLLQLQQLYRLYLDHNQLEIIPQDIDKMHSLQSFSLGYNKISAICDNLFNIRGLQALCFRGNRLLSTLPPSIKNLIGLQKLDMSYCDLQLIPSTISSCTVLRSLYISNNRLIQLPSEISQCYRLEKLDISCNKLTYLPAALLFRQTQLSIQTFGNNFLKKNDPSLQWTCVEQVLLNCLRRVPSLWQLSRLAVDRWGLNTVQLPLPVQSELTNQTGCYHCWRKNNADTIELVKFLNFDPKPHPQLGLSQEYPFLFSFCSSHTEIRFLDKLDLCIDVSSFT